MINNNHRLFFYLGTFISAVFISSCDKIKPPFKEEINVDTSCVFVPDNSVPYRKVLVEDYTGHTCGNCPPAGIYLNDTLHQKYGDSLISMSVHAGYFALTAPNEIPLPSPTLPAGAFSYDFRSPVGSDWNSFFGIAIYPVGMVNRTGYPTSDHQKLKSQWDNTIRNQLNTNPKFRLRIYNNFDQANRKLNTCIEAKSLENISGDYKLQVVLTEDSISNWQVWYNHSPEYVPDYIHRHILRRSLNTSFGTQVFSADPREGDTSVQGFFMFLDPAWNPEHCSVVAFIYHTTTFEILQVEQAKLF